MVIELIGKFEGVKLVVMSVAEMKVEVINKITTVEDETILKEVLSILKGANGKDVPYNLSSTYKEIKDQYGDVLQKLAQ